VTARPRDYAWLAVAVLVAFGFLAGAVQILWEVANSRTAMRALWLPVGLVCAGVLVALAWRRTVWGRPSQE
jgi:uncharacterized membrane protein